MTNFAEKLRLANRARAAIWHPDTPITLQWRVNELMGEIGEVCNVLKKFHREELKLVGSRDTIPHLAEELADVVICIDLLGLTVHSTPQGAYVRTPGLPLMGDPSSMGCCLMAAATPFSQLAMMAADQRDNMDGKYLLWKAMQITLGVVSFIADHYGIDLPSAVTEKFNATSEKVGIDVHLTGPKPKERKLQ